MSKQYLIMSKEKPKLYFIQFDKYFEYRNKE